MRLKRTHILVVLSVVAVSIFVMFAYHFQEGIDVIFSMADTENAKYLKNGDLKINGIKIPGPGAFTINPDDGQAYANQYGNTYILVDPPEI